MSSSSTSGTANKGAYDPSTIESRIYRLWLDCNHFHARVNPDKQPYTIVIPPPNVTGALHMGHALNNTIQDVLIRFHRQRGFEACWIPGTDHAGIATQSVVERRLFAEEGKTRHDLGREALVARIWAWKDEYEARILGQLKKLGCSCDWERTAFTMSERLSAAVRTVFLRLFHDGLIYRGQRLINWSVGIHTALSNDELVYKEVTTNFWYVRYPLVGDPVDGMADIMIATTRPETMIGDTAVCVHPNPRAELERRRASSSQEEREAAERRLADAEAMARLEAYAKMIGREVELPLMGRRIPVIGDAELADPALGTGALKVTPAHDPNDYAAGLRNDLPMLNIYNDDGTINDAAPAKYRGLFGQREGRKAVVADLEAGGYLVKTEPLTHSVAHCYRSDTIVEPYLSEQWFVQMQPLVEKARVAVQQKRVRFVPASRERLFMQWLDSTPDWCISRQLWWGHQIPVWYDVTDRPDAVHTDKDGNPIKIAGDLEPIVPRPGEPDPPDNPRYAGRTLVRDPDMLDTWFSSMLWPLSTLGWPEHTPDLDYFYPTDVLSTARDIIALWVARMIMMGETFAGDFGKPPAERQPFRDVYIHGTILDEHGDIMSKSRGNGFDPVKAIEGGSDEIHAAKALHGLPKDRLEHYMPYGADAVRYALMSMCTGGQDMRLRVERDRRKAKTAAGLAQFDVTIPRFEEGRRFANKMWQASHGVALAGIEPGFTLAEEPSSHLEDRWMLARLRHGVTAITTAIERYEMAEACDMLYRLFWDEYCSFYLEMVKHRLRSDVPAEAASRRHARTTVIRTLDALLRLAHPIMPFISEAIWQQMRPYVGDGEPAAALVVAAWPQAEAYAVADEAEALSLTNLAREVVAAINRIRADQASITEQTPLPKVLLTGPAGEAGTLEGLQPLLAGVARMTKVAAFEAAPGLPKPKLAASAVVGRLELHLPLKGLIDVEAEKARLAKEIARLRDFVAKLEAKLGNENYTSRAPADVVQRDREKLAETQEALVRLEVSAAALG